MLIFRGDCNQQEGEVYLLPFLQTRKTIFWRLAAEVKSREGLLHV